MTNMTLKQRIREALKPVDWAEASAEIEDIANFTLCDGVDPLNPFRPRSLLNSIMRDEQDFGLPPLFSDDEDRY